MTVTAQPLAFPFAYIEDREVWGNRFRFLIASQRGEHWYGRKSQCNQAHCAETEVGNCYNPDLRAMIEPGARIIDVGCNEGFVACCMAAQAGPNGAVLAFDPVEVNCVLTETNARLNAFLIQVHRLAVSSSAGGSLAVNAERIVAEGPHVPTTRLDDWIDFRPTVIKIDCEGYELEVLRGARQTLAECRPKLEIEIHLCGAEGVDMRSYGFDPQEILAILTAADYEVQKEGRVLDPKEALPDHGYYLHCYPR